MEELNKILSTKSAHEHSSGAQIKKLKTACVHKQQRYENSDVLY